MPESIPAGILKRAIAYYYLLSYCPPAKVTEFMVSTEALRKSLAKEAGMDQQEFFEQVIPRVCQRIVSFHEDTRQPSPEFVEPLVSAAREAERSPQAMAAFQAEMSRIARLKSRALPENRLHRKKGCAYCRLPCHYGYFTLVSDPDFKELQRLMESETSRPVDERTPLRPVWAFTFWHLGHILQSVGGYIQRVHAGNLAFCLLMLSMAKSRLPLPEQQIKAFQAVNQALIQAG